MIQFPQSKYKDQCLQIFLNSIMPYKLLYLFAICLFCPVHSKLLPQHHQKTITVSIVGTNDIHGTAFPQQIMDVQTASKYKYGGLVYMARLIQIIKKQFGSHFLYLDGGDQFQGGIEAGPHVSQGQIIAEFFNIMGLSASAIGNHEFDFGLQFLEKYLKIKNAPSLAANILLKNKKNDFIGNNQGTKLFDLGDIKIGVIGLSTIETKESVSKFVYESLQDYEFLPYKQIVIEKSKHLRSQGAHAVLIVSHMGNKCTSNFQYDVRDQNTEQQSCIKDEMNKLIDSIPEGTIDGVVQGHRHCQVHYWYKNVPIIGSINNGFYFNVLYLNFDPITKKIVSSDIQGPIPVCQKIFSNHHDCQYKNKTQRIHAGDLTQWSFHHQPVYAHPQLMELYTSKWKPLMERYESKIFDTQIVLKPAENGESALGNLITEILLRIPDKKVDFSIFQNGGFRSIWYPGTVQYQDFYAMFPFQNRVQTFEIKGKDLLKMLKIVQTGSKSFYNFGGIRQTLRIRSDGVQGEKGCFVSAQMMDGSEISAQRMYRGISNDFLLEGGDDFSQLFRKKDEEKLKISNVADIGQLRQQLMKELQKIGVVKEQDWSVDEDDPHMIILRS